MIIKRLKDYFNQRKGKCLKIRNSKSFNNTTKINNKKVREKSYLYQRAQNLLAKN